MLVNSIDSGIETLGDAYRGLWRSVFINKKTRKKEEGWACTFLFKGEMVETDYFDSPVEALTEAIRIKDF